MGDPFYKVAAFDSTGDISFQFRSALLETTDAASRGRLSFGTHRVALQDGTGRRDNDVGGRSEGVSISRRREADRRLRRVGSLIRFRRSVSKVSRNPPTSPVHQ